MRPSLSSVTRAGVDGKIIAQEAVIQGAFKGTM
jgi:hypothetical protein